MRASISGQALVSGTGVAALLVFALATSLWMVVETSSGAVAGIWFGKRRVVPGQGRCFALRQLTDVHFTSRSRHW
jgi:hypothetical protein